MNKLKKMKPRWTGRRWMKHLFKTFSSNNLAVFIFLFILILLAYHTLFSSYFESDEWFYLTYYLPLTRAPQGWLTAISATFTQSGHISGGQHVVPIASLIYYLNTKFFGLNFIPYAFLSLFIHSINSYLVFTVVKVFLRKKSPVEKNTYALLSSLFFALSPIPMHAFTGFAAFYGQNVLSTTFFLLCILSYELSFIKKSWKYILLTVLFLFFALFTQESTFFLFFVLPVMTVFKKKKFSYKFLSMLWTSCLFVYFLIRFFIPNMNFILGHILKIFLPSLQVTSPITNSIAQGLSIYPNLPAELLFRTITFPLRMLGSIFIPKDTLFAVAQVLAPIISPRPPGGDATTQAAFMNYSGQSIMMYSLAFTIITCCVISITKFVKKMQYEEANFIVTGLFIILFGALPLVAIIFTFPLWGYDIYFDWRHYYTPTVGAALLFPFLIIGLSTFIARHLHIKKSEIVAFIILIAFVLCNIPAFTNNIHTNTQNYSQDRRVLVKQLTDYLPKLQPKTVFYIQTDGKSPFESLPFFTSVPQALTVVYYSRNPLPDSFFNKPLFSGKPEGYQYENGRGFGYYISKKELIAAIQADKFDPNNVHAFYYYYYGKEAKLRDITAKIRSEIKKF